MASMQWFRFYSEALDDPKVQRLPGDLFKVWVNLLCLANRGEPRGLLPPLEDIAFALRISEAEASRALDELVGRGLFDRGDQGTEPHNWRDRQPDSDTPSAAAERKRRQRARERQSRDSHSDSHAEVTPQSREEEEKIQKATTAFAGVIALPVAGERSADELTNDIICAANRGMLDNPAIGDAANPIPIGHSSRQDVRDWLAAGVPFDLIVETVYERAKDYKPDGAHRRQVSSMAYFSGAVDEADRRRRAKETEVPAGDGRSARKAAPLPGDPAYYTPRPFLGLNS